MTELEEKIGYEFKDVSLLERAVTTPSVRMCDPGAKDNQRLEFLGDAVFGLLSAERVFSENPDNQEGLLTVRRTHLVSGAALAEAAEKLGLRNHLKRNVGAHELAKNSKLLADALEAVMGAVWLDGGLSAVRAFFEKLELPFDEKFNEWAANPKGFLQIKAQACHPPQKVVYEVVEIKGSAHEPIVTIKASVKGLGEAEATAISKSAAEVAAADALLQRLDQEK